MNFDDSIDVLPSEESSLSNSSFALAKSPITAETELDLVPLEPIVTADEPEQMNVVEGKDFFKNDDIHLFF